MNFEALEQYFDKETNLHYNYFRDYDPAIGRYIQSDPIGLLGGLNTYAYAGGDALRFFDPTGEFTAVEGVALTGLAIVGGMIYIQQQQQQRRDGSSQSSDPFDGPTGANSSASSTESASSSGGQVKERKLTWPSRPSCGCSCTCRADANLNISTNKPGTAMATATGASCRDARTQAARAATRMLGQQPKHVQCRCVDDKGNRYYM